MNDLYDDIDRSNSSAYIDLENKDIAELSQSIYATDTDSFAFKEKKKKVKHPMFRGVTHNELKRGIIFSEILGKPKAL